MSDWYSDFCFPHHLASTTILKTFQPFWLPSDYVLPQTNQAPTSTYTKHYLPLVRWPALRSLQSSETQLVQMTALPKKLA